MKLGVIGGSGLYAIDSLKEVRQHLVCTPYGEPSDYILEGELHGASVFFLPRHGRSHHYLPSEIPYRANICALKQLGVTHILAVSAVGILSSAIKQGDFIAPDQIFDRTLGYRQDTFFGEGVVAHFSFGEPFCEKFRSLVVESAQKVETCHSGGTYVCIEGPRYSSRAESQFYRDQLQASVIGMTGMPEAVLAREAELSYAMLAMGTDYDSWRVDGDAVATDKVVEVLQANGEKARAVVAEVVQQSQHFELQAQSGLETSLLTPFGKLSQVQKNRLMALFGQGHPIFLSKNQD